MGAKPNDAIQRVATRVTPRAAIGDRGAVQLEDQTSIGPHPNGDQAGHGFARLLPSLMSTSSRRGRRYAASWPKRFQYFLRARRRMERSLCTRSGLSV